MDTLVDPRPAPPLVLVVDDDAHVRAFVRELLTDAGFRILEAADGEEVLGLGRQHRPDLIVLDVMMRGMDGYAALARLRGDPVMQDVPVIIVTAQEEPIYRTLSAGVGATCHLTKPFIAATFVETVRRILAERRDSPKGCVNE
jgi:CheY-like chemotaxis protein